MLLAEQKLLKGSKDRPRFLSRVSRAFVHAISDTRSTNITIEINLVFLLSFPLFLLFFWINPGSSDCRDVTRVRFLFFFPPFFRNVNGVFFSLCQNVIAMLGELRDEFCIEAATVPVRSCLRVFRKMIDLRAKVTRSGAVIFPFRFVSFSINEISHENFHETSIGETKYSVWGIESGLRIYGVQKDFENLKIRFGFRDGNGDDRKEQFIIQIRQWTERFLFHVDSPVVTRGPLKIPPIFHPTRFTRKLRFRWRK